MQARVSTKGQIVLPGPIRRRLGIQPGDHLDVHIENDRIVLAPQAQPSFEPRIVKETKYGIPVLDLGPNAPILTSEKVAELLTEFP
ncbi:AbrB/MazE/SpoVT family DNA-binding domain-containing protein [Telmatobacter bradus]|uniref:AbrB/MazE/SpoVT family DNA-binding domain-containing protein n=1 Tax=Telmatobacter bradus TaxID=474953 RepID=UPI003B42A2CF